MLTTTSMILPYDSISEFLAQRRIAVVGVSRNRETPANLIYRKMREAGYRTFAVNPNARSVEGDDCYSTLASIPGGVDGVVIVTNARTTGAIVRECVLLGIPRIWMHRSFGTGSVNTDAAELARQHGLEVIVGGCPMMFMEPIDVGHKCIRWILGVNGSMPAPVMPVPVMPAPVMPVLNREYEIM